MFVTEGVEEGYFGGGQTAELSISSSEGPGSSKAMVMLTPNPCSGSNCLDSVETISLPYSHA